MKQRVRTRRKTRQRGGAGERTQLHEMAKNGILGEVKKLIAARKDIINKQDDKGRTALYEAASEGHIEVVKELIAAGADMNIMTTVNGYTPMIVALMQNHLNVVDVLISKGANPNLMSKNGVIPLMMAIEKRHIEVVQMLIAVGADLNIKNPDGITPLFRAMGIDITIVPMLIAGGADINTRAYDGSMTPLMRALERGNNELFRMFIDAGADINIGDKNGTTPLMLAIDKGFTNIAKMLMERGADLHKVTVTNFTALLCAIRTKQWDLALSLIPGTGPNINLMSNYGWTPLLLTLGLNGPPQVVKALISAGANVNVKQPANLFDPISGYVPVKDDTPLNYAAWHGNIDSAELLIAAGADVNAKNYKGNTPLQFAIISTRLDMVRTLIAAGADINLKNNNGLAPLMGALERADMDTVKFLIAAGADLNIRDSFGRGMLEIALHNGNMGLLKMLIDKGANPNLMNENGMTPLMEQLDRQNISMVKILIAGGADVNIKYPDGTTSLMKVLERGDNDLVKLFIEKGADINIKYPDGMTPLIKALELGNKDLARIFIDGGADINIGDKNGVTPLMWAINKGFTNIAKMLMERGADLHKVTVNNSTVLLYATISRQWDLALSLIPDPNINLMSSYGWTPLLLTLALNGPPHVVKALISAGANVNVKQPDKNLSLSYGNPVYVPVKDATPLHYAAGSGNIDSAELLIAAGADVNAKNYKRNTPLSISISKGHIDLVQLLISTGADINSNNDEGSTPAFIAARYGQVQILEGLLRNEAFNKEKIIRNDMTLYDFTNYGHSQLFYQNGVAIGEQVITLIRELAKPKVRMWNGGWDRSDISRLDLVFENALPADGKPPPSSNYACCPVCLKLTERSSGCMYVLDHNCSQSGGLYHKGLYEKYKDPGTGNIMWCALCGRIAIGHKHYHVAPAQGGKPALYPADDYFARDCRGHIGGGGLPEKVERFRILREAFLIHLEDVDKKPYTQVLEAIIEAVWNAPLNPGYKGISERILAEKKWDFPLEVFPVSLEKEEAINITKLPDIVKSEEERALVPTKMGEGENFLGTEGMLYKFHNHKEDTYLSPAGLEYYIKGIVDGYTNGTDEESLGKCFTPGCKYKLYPEDIKGLVPDELYNKYRHIFNFKFRKLKGGARKTHKTHKTHKRRKDQRNKFVNYKRIQTKKREF